MKNTGKINLAVSFHVALLCCAGVSAQDTAQTAKGAQTFLGLMAEEKSVTLTIHEPGGDVVQQANVIPGSYTVYENSARRRFLSHDSNYSENLLPFENFSISVGYMEGGRMALCSSAFYVRGPFRRKAGPFQIHNEVANAGSIGVWEFIDPMLLYAGPHELDWSSVAVRRTDGRVVLGQKNGANFALLSDDPEILDRVEYAAKFLKLSCNRADATGF